MRLRFAGAYRELTGGDLRFASERTVLEVYLADRAFRQLDAYLDQFPIGNPSLIAANAAREKDSEQQMLAQIGRLAAGMRGGRSR